MGEKRLDHLLADLLKENEGVFLGEEHNSPSLRQAVLELLPMLKANGVGTVSFEIPQSLVDEVLETKNIREFLANWPGADQKDFARIYEFVQTANRHGLKVLGHEKPSELLAIRRFDPKSLNMFTIRKNDDLHSEHISEFGMNQRNLYAADYIHSHRTGKVVVIGGAWHSGNYTKADLPTTKFDEDLKKLQSAWCQPESTYAHVLAFNHWYSSAGTAQGGVEVKDRYQGLDVKLRYPSVDFNPLGGHVGFTQPTDGKFNNYEVFLPHDLGQLRITSLPAKTPPGRKPEVAQKMTQR